MEADVTKCRKLKETGVNLRQSNLEIVLGRRKTQTPSPNPGLPAVGENEHPVIGRSPREVGSFGTRQILSVPAVFREKAGGGRWSVLTVK